MTFPFLQKSCSEFFRENPWLSGTGRGGGRVRGYQGRFDPEGRTLAERYPEGKVYLAQIGDFSESPFAPDFGDLVRYAAAYLNLPVRYGIRHIFKLKILYLFSPLFSTSYMIFF